VLISETPAFLLKIKKVAFGYAIFFILGILLDTYFRGGKKACKTIDERR